MGELDLQQLQVGAEETRGTGVAPTAKLMMIEDCNFVPIREVLQPEERRGSLQPAYNALMLKTTSEGSVEGLVTYEDLPYLLDSLLGEATPSGTTSPYTYSYTAPTTTAPTPRIMTMVYGDGTYAYGVTGAICNELVLSMAQADAMRFSASLLGHNIADDALESLSDRTVEGVEPDQMALYIDAWGGTMGDTAIATSLFNFELSLSANLANKFHLGAATPGGYRVARMNIGLKLFLELTAGTDTYLGSIVGSAPLQHQVRIKATSSTKVIQLDFAGTVVEPPTLWSDEDGVVSVEIGYAGEYHSTFANSFKAEVQNAVANLP